MNLAIELKQQGQQTALDHAGDEWVERALRSLKWYCSLRREGVFLFEEFRYSTIMSLMPDPPSSKVWGALPKIAVKRGIIADTGEYRKTTSPKTRSHPAKLWRAI